MFTVFPPKCLGCLKEGKYLCDCCKAKNNSAVQFCYKCQTINSYGLTCTNCKKDTNLDFLLSPFIYDNHLPIAKIIKEFKYNGYTRLIGYIEKEINNFLTYKYKIFQNAILVPIPLHPKRQKLRGFNQSELIANFISKIIGTKSHNLILRSKNTKQQAKLTKKLRKNNLKNAFTINSNINLHNNKIILIDDVFSTGSTIEEAAITIRKHYKNKKTPTIGAFTIARA